MNNLDLFRHDFVLSIKPEYATKIVGGQKTVELRRRFPYGTVTGAVMYVYASMPIQAVIGHATISTVEELPIEVIWARYHDIAFITREDFDNYYADRRSGFVIKLKDPVRISEPVPLATLKDRLGFTPPQSFAYADESFRQLIRGHDK
jgi:predicted transcriptional regulator